MVAQGAWASDPAAIDLDAVYRRAEIFLEPLARPIVVSPDGRKLIYALQDPVDDKVEGRFRPNGAPTQSSEGARLFLVDLPGGTPRQVCAAPGASDWDVSWSPDGRLAAFYSDRDGAPRLWVLDVESGECRRVSDQTVKSLAFPFEQPRWSPDGSSLYVPTWPLEGPGALAEAVKPPRVGTPPPGGDAGVTVYRHTPGAAAPQASGTQDAQTFDARCDGTAYGAASLTRVRLADGLATPVVDADVVGAREAADRHRPWPHMRLSSSGLWVSYYTSICTLPGSLYDDAVDLYVVRADGGVPIRIAQGLRPSGGGGESDFGYRWNPDRDELVYLRDRALYRVDLSGDAPSQPHRLAEDLGALAWDILHYLPGGQNLIVGVGDRGWARQGGGRAAPIDLALVPLDGSEPVRTPLAGRFSLSQIISADERTAWTMRDGVVLARGREGSDSRTALFEIDLRGRTARSVWRGDAVVEAPVPTAFGLAMVHQDFSTPRDVALMDRRFERIERISRAAPALNALTVGGVERFETVVPREDGSLVTVKTAVILPPGSSRDAPPPAVVWFYPSQDYTRALSEFGAPGMGDLAHVLTGHGYAVILVDLPIAPGGQRGHIIDETMDMLMPQVYRAADLGLVDIQRLAIRGQSFGGFATAAIISRTNLFRAAIPSSGMYDLGGAYGQVEYGVTELTDGGVWMEASQPRLGASVWADPMRYIANSPYYLADRIQTPVLIIQGDQDYTGYREAGKLFAALRRLDRPVELALYAGAGHSPPHWRPDQAADQMRRTLEFLDRHLKTPSGR